MIPNIFALLFFVSAASLFTLYVYKSWQGLRNGFPRMMQLPMHQPLGIFGIDKAIADIKDSIVKSALWIAVGLLGLIFLYSAIQTVSSRFTNAALDWLSNPFVLGLIMGLIAVSAFFFLPKPDVTLYEGDHVVCEDNQKAVYRYTEGQLRGYPDPNVARSWGWEWKSATNNNNKVIPQKQCDSLIKGPPMDFNLQEGDHVACEQNPGGIYQFTEGKLRPYPDPDVARSWGHVWKSATNNNNKMISSQLCNKIEKGLPMPLKLDEGDHVACRSDTRIVYRYTGNVLRPYPNPEIARSWGWVWVSETNNNNKFISTQQCNEMEKGPPMPMKLVEGDHVACEPNTGAVYRYTRDTLRPYPNPEIARSWGWVWISATNNNNKVISKAQCDQIPKGSPMEMNTGR